MSAYSKWNYWGTWTKARCTIDASLTASPERHVSVSLVWLNLTFPFFRQFSSETFRRFWRTPRGRWKCRNKFVHLSSFFFFPLLPNLPEISPQCWHRSHLFRLILKSGVCLSVECSEVWFSIGLPPPPWKKCCSFDSKCQSRCFRFKKCYSEGIETLIRNLEQLFSLTRSYLLLYRDPFSN